MSGYKMEIVNFGAGTGPMNTNHDPLKLTPKLKWCPKCGKDQDPAGGVQVSTKTWMCAKHWRLRLQGR